MPRSWLSARLGFLVAILGMAVPAPAGAAGFADCVTAAAAANFAAAKDFQTELRDLTVAQAPQFKSLADINRDLQVAFAEARKARFGYLLHNDPGRIETAKGLVRFSNIDWSKEDAARFSKSDAAYRGLESRMAKLKAQNNGHSDWPRLREVFRAQVATTPEYKALMARFSAGRRKVNSILAGCKRE